MNVEYTLSSSIFAEHIDGKSIDIYGTGTVWIEVLM